MDDAGVRAVPVGSRSGTGSRGAGGVRPVRLHRGPRRSVSPRSATASPIRIWRTRSGAWSSSEADSDCHGRPGPGARHRVLVRVRLGRGLPGPALLPRRRGGRSVFRPHRRPARGDEPARGQRGNEPRRELTRVYLAGRRRRRVLVADLRQRRIRRPRRGADVDRRHRRGFRSGAEFTTRHGHRSAVLPGGARRGRRGVAARAAPGRSARRGARPAHRGQHLRTDPGGRGADARQPRRRQAG